MEEPFDANENYNFLIYVHQNAVNQNLCLFETISNHIVCKYFFFFF